MKKEREIMKERDQERMEKEEEKNRRRGVVNERKRHGKNGRG